MTGGWRRLAVGGGVTVAIIAMFAYVSTLDLPSDAGANIGAGVLALEVMASLALLVVAGVLSGAGAFRRRMSP
jgi:hypothetical protein